MIINRNSWYIRLIRFYDRKLPTNLCELIRGTFICLVLALLMAAILLVLTGISLYAFMPIVTNDYDLLLCFTGISFNGFLVFHTANYLIEYYDIDNFATRSLRLPDEDTEGSEAKFTTVIGKYVKAVHDKTCPIIRYKQ